MLPAGPNSFQLVVSALPGRLVELQAGSAFAAEVAADISENKHHDCNILTTTANSLNTTANSFVIGIAGTAVINTHTHTTKSPPQLSQVSAKMQHSTAFNFVTVTCCFRQRGVWICACGRVFEEDHLDTPERLSIYHEKLPVLTTPSSHFQSVDPSAMSNLVYNSTPSVVCAVTNLTDGQGGQLAATLLTPEFFTPEFKIMYTSSRRTSGARCEM